MKYNEESLKKLDRQYNKELEALSDKADKELCSDNKEKYIKRLRKYTNRLNQLMNRHIDRIERLEE